MLLHACYPLACAVAFPLLPPATSPSYYSPTLRSTSAVGTETAAMVGKSTNCVVPIDRRVRCVSP